METLLRNVRLTFRQMRAQPGVTASIMLTLGLAIGATTTIFSFVNSLLLRPFPFSDPEQLVEIASLRSGQEGKLSIREVLDIKEQVPSIAEIAARTGAEGGYNFSGEGKPEEWKTVLTTGNLFQVLGIPLSLGRPWPDHSDRERDNRVVLNHGVWLSKFGGSSNVVGKSIVLDHASGYRIDGVAAANFDYPTGIQVYRSLGGFALYDRRDYRNVIAVARIKRPLRVEHLQAELDALSQRLALNFPATNAGLQLHARSFRSIYSGDVRPYLLLLTGAVGFVLLIACGNVVNLLLSRGLSRDREIAVRFALGASRRNVLIQLVTESLVLSLFAAGFGILLALWWMRVLRLQIGVEMPSWIAVNIDAGVLWVSLGVSVLAGLVSALLPALHVIRPSLSSTLREGGRGSSSGKAAGRLRNAMVISEIAIAVVLLSGAGLLIRSFLTLQSQSKGFDTTNISTFRVALGWKRYTSQVPISHYFEQLQSKLKAAPGIQDVAFISSPPLSRLERNPNTVGAEGQAVDEIRRNPYVNHLAISENYFQLVHIPVTEGRPFGLFDNPSTELVAIVSDRLAKRLWPGTSPIGRRLRYDPLSKNPGKLHKVVGVVRSVQHDQLGGELSMDMYVPCRQEAPANQFMLCKTALGPREFQSLAEKIAWGIDPQQSIFDFASYDQRIADSIWQLRLSRLLLVLFGVVALTLAAIGIYSVLSYVVRQRTREMGVRLALGATPSAVQRLVFKSGAGLGAAGLTIGLLGAVALSQWLHSFLTVVTGFDFLSLFLTLLLLMIAMVLACTLPAFKASRVNPIEALRNE